MMMKEVDNLNRVTMSVDWKIQKVQMSIFDLDVNQQKFSAIFNKIPVRFLVAIDKIV